MSFMEQVRYDMVDSGLGPAIAETPNGRFIKADAVTNLTPQNTKPDDNQVQILLGTPTLGMVHIRWHNAMVGIVSPPNFAIVRSTPLLYTVPDAQNFLCEIVLRNKFRALLLIEDDTIPPPETLLVMDRWFWKMERKLAPPVVSGVYHIKGSGEVRKGKTADIKLLGPEPLIYRGGGNRAFRDFEYGDVVPASGVPTGALLIHRAVLDAWAAEPDIEYYAINDYPYPIRKIFQQPSQVWRDPDGGVRTAAGTTDLWWCDQTIKRDILSKAGWPDTFAKAEFPFLVDTSLRFGHIDRSTGVIY